MLDLRSQTSSREKAAHPGALLKAMFLMVLQVCLLFLPLLDLPLERDVAGQRGFSPEVDVQLLSFYIALGVFDPC